MFIFASLMEFAFVNSISRIQRTVEVKSFTAKSILPAAASVFATPSFSRRNSLDNSGKGKKKDSDGDVDPGHRFFVNKVAQGLQAYEEVRGRRLEGKGKNTFGLPFDEERKCAVSFSLLVITSKKNVIAATATAVP